MILTPNERKYLLESMKKLLSEYNHEHTDDALNKIIDEWSEKKKVLISAFRKHPNYVDGKFMIVFPHKYTRSKNEDAIRKFSCWLEWDVIPFIRAPKNIFDRREPGCALLPDKLYKFLTKLHSYSDVHISNDTAIMLNKVIPEINPRAGQKTSRIVNKICTYLNYDKDGDYNKEFAKYADALNPITIERKIILSLNPLDYLTMSFGNSWSSCHTIDKANIRNMPSGYRGAYSSGTISYMLDGSSMVLYTVDSDYSGDEYWNEPKINRQMFHYGNDKLVQGRLYPQANDSCGGSLYEQYRNVVQEIMSTIFEFPNLWALKSGTSAIRDYIISRGTNYKDYLSFNNCTISKNKNVVNEAKFVIGEQPICISCGNRHWLDGEINCCTRRYQTCANCGCIVDEDDTYIINGVYYCNDCICCCEDCDEAVINTYEVYDSYGYRYVCEDCRDRYYNYCDDCGNYIHEDLGTYVESVDRWVCDDCLREHFFVCEECGEYHLKYDRCVYDDKVVCENCYNTLSTNAQN